MLTFHIPESAFAPFYDTPVAFHGERAAARPVARWDVVPDQRVSGVFRAGVCAFHEDGVRVAFSLNG
jgi:hypothetical protein